jgi:hypothetical protein
MLISQMLAFLCPSVSQSGDSNIHYQIYGRQYVHHTPCLRLVLLQSGDTLGSSVFPT